ncbi:uncharacterized PE-PGRS family protein PE_PGRS54-like [Zingiber officinale]|uniref:uncharacterized PE-PGRS family protein PE_PGRS54-like n=1 Tax=Zingiber officinale TaxID=94328 RepID=UPI001C4D8FE7|nr:uncharacterized PE-PGRS family protein PE_PGRS54-like [Zingiber officinale]
MLGSSSPQKSVNRLFIDSANAGIRPRVVTISVRWVGTAAGTGGTTGAGAIGSIWVVVAGGTIGGGTGNGATGTVGVGAGYTVGTGGTGVAGIGYTVGSSGGGGWYAVGLTGAGAGYASGTPCGTVNTAGVGTAGAAEVGTSKGAIGVRESDASAVS